MTMNIMIVRFLFEACLLLHPVHFAVNGFLLSPLPFFERQRVIESTSMEKTWAPNVSTFKKSKQISETALEMSSSKHQEQVMKVPRGAPQAFSYNGDKFYIRSCYDKYYHKIMDELLGRSDYYYVSVTGTPGIGKSMFYLYFLNRYLKENPGKSVITASFNTHGGLLDCQLFRPNGVVEICTDVSGNYMIPVLNTVSWPNDIDCDLYLYDGPPKRRPNGVKMIAFTSPNFSWLDSMRKECKHSIVFMPTWDRTELLAANKALELNIDETELSKRFTLFGGCAKFCLSTDDTFVLHAERMIDVIISRITSIDELEKYFICTFDVESVVHRLMHYIPEDDASFANFYPASPLISKKLYCQFKKILKGNRKLLIEFLNGNGIEDQIARWLFEHDTHELLSNDGRFQIRSLSDSSHSKIDINTTIGEYSRFSMNPDEDEEVLTNIYRMPESSTYPSIDSYFLTEKSIIMFLITIKQKHPLKSSGLIKCLQSLDQLNRVKANPLLAQLIFVVPKGLGENFRSQDIEFPMKWKGKEMGIGEIPGIGPKKRKKLFDLGIKTSTQLIEAYNRQDENLKFVQSSLKKWMDDRKKGIDYRFLERIPQYVIEVESSFYVELNTTEK